MTEKINNLIINLYDVKAEKNSVIKKQMYEKASFLRDEERTIERNLYSMIFSGKVFNQIDLDNWLKTYLKEYYNIDYDSIYKKVDSCVKREKFYLIEALANSIALNILKDHRIESVVVRVRKPHAPVKGVLDTVEVEIERNQKDYD